MGFRRAALFALAAALAFPLIAWLVLSMTPPRGFFALPSGRSAELPAFADENGAPTEVGAFRGKVIIINLWATWCAPCIEEMPSLDRLAARLPAASFAVVAVNQDRAGASVARAAFDRLKLQNLRLYLDPEHRLRTAIGARGMPTTLILGRDGTPVSYREGVAAWDSEEMVGYLRGLAEHG